MGKELLKTKEVSNILGIAISSVHHLVRTGKLQPVNKSNWQIDGGYLFKKEDVLKFQEQKGGNGIPITQAARLIGVTPATLLRLIEKKEIPYQLKKRGQRKTYLVNEETIQRLKQRYQRRRKINIIHKQGIPPFAKLINDDGKIARLVDMDQRIVMTEEGEFISLESAIEKGFSWKGQYVHKYSHYTGEKVQFSFVKPAFIQSLVYDVIDLFYRIAGPQNTDIIEKNGHLLVEIKPILIRKKDFEDLDSLYVFLNKHIRKGSISKNKQTLKISNTHKTVLIYLNENLHQYLKERAMANGYDVGEYITCLLEDFVKNEQRQQDKK
mgnify:CR=1 FL=1